MDYFRAWRRFWVVLVGCSLAGLLGGFIAAKSITPQYSSTAGVVFAVANTGSAVDMSQASNYAMQQMPTYVEIAASSAVLDPVIKSLGLNTTSAELAAHVTAQNPVETLVVGITVKEPDAAQSARIANAVAAQLGQVVEGLSTSGTSKARVLSSSVISPAVTPTAPATPNKKLCLMLGLLAGLALGAVAAIVIDTVRPVRPSRSRALRGEGATTVASDHAAIEAP